MNSPSVAISSRRQLVSDIPPREDERVSRSRSAILQYNLEIDRVLRLVRNVFRDGGFEHPARLVQLGRGTNVSFLDGFHSFSSVCPYPLFLPSTLFLRIRWGQRPPEHGELRGVARPPSIIHARLSKPFITIWWIRILSGPISRDVAILSLRYPISRDTF